uniref:Ribosomal protein L20 n=1 Tax=Phyllymenia taiwanensis TaxID=1260292 RepID=A0A0A1ES61_9FLOR|nr:ribosomal protein L20 [Grateloupia taiwanensis]
MKQEILQTKSRKLKKRGWQKRVITQINSSSYLSYNLLMHFIRKEKLKLNKKLLANFFVSEAGTSFSLRKWMLWFYGI